MHRHIVDGGILEDAPHLPSSPLGKFPNGREVGSRLSTKLMCNEFSILEMAPRPGFAASETSLSDKPHARRDVLHMLVGQCSRLSVQ
jgi:hypothetical protein